MKSCQIKTGSSNPTLIFIRIFLFPHPTPPHTPFFSVTKNSSIACKAKVPLIPCFSVYLYSVNHLFSKNKYFIIQPTHNHLLPTQKNLETYISIHKYILIFNSFLNEFPCNLQILPRACTILQIFL